MTERRALWIALVLNAALAVVELVAAWITRSVALAADAIDFVEDSALYALILVMNAKAQAVEARLGRVIASLMALPGIVALVQVVRQLASGAPPPGLVVSGVALLALAANLVTAAVILAARRRAGEAVGLGLRAAWLSSRNDALANVAMIVAGLMVLATGSGWPDIVTGLGVAALHLSGAAAIWGAAGRAAT
ncbi:MAG: cation transporter [Gemmobacter sp.]